MTIRQITTTLSIAALLSLSHGASQAETYQFQFLANPDALDATQNKSLDVLHTITLDSSKIAAFNVTTLSKTASWLGGGIDMTMSHNGKTVRLNDGLDPTSAFPSVKGSYGYSEGLLSLSPGTSWFFAMEFAPGNPFIDGNALPYDPFVYGFLFAYQNQQSYIDFGKLWATGDTSILSKYSVSAVPEPSTALTAALGVGLLIRLTRKKQAAAA